MAVPTPARAADPPSFAQQDPGYRFWRWATVDPPQNTITAIAVRDDGYLIASEYTTGPDRSGDGCLHLVPPWGGVVSASTCVGPREGFIGLAIAGGYLFAAPQSPREDQAHPGRAAMYRMDPYSFAVLDLVWVPYYFPTLTVDASNGWLMWPTNSTVPGGKGGIDEMDPRTETVRTVVRSSQTSTVTSSEWVAATSDGSNVLADDASTLAIFDRKTGQYLSENHLASINDTFLVPAVSCLGGALLYTDGGGTDDHENLYALPPPYATSTPKAIGLDAQHLRSSPYDVMAATVDTHGNAVFDMGDYVTVVGCAGYTPPQPPSQGGKQPTTGGGPAGQPNQRPGSPHDTTGSSGPPPAQPGGGARPALPAGGPQPPAATIPQGSAAGQTVTTPVQAPQALPQGVQQPASAYLSQSAAQGASQAATAPNAVGLADAPQDDAAIGFAASGLPAGVPPTLYLGFLAGTALLLGAAGAATARRDDHHDHGAALHGAADHERGWP